jgi:hypothetical protein
MSGRSHQIRHAAEWVAGLAPSDVPADVIALAKAQRINIVAAMFAGARTAIGRRIIAAVDAVDPGGPVTSLPDGIPVSM